MVAIEIDMIQQTWNETPLNIDIKLTVPHVTQRDKLDSTIKRNQTLAMVEDTFPLESLVNVCTKGSDTNTVTNGAASIVIFNPEGERHKISKPTRKYCTSYAAVVQALVYGIDKAEQHRGECQ